MYALAALGAALALAPTAMAGTATYNSTAPLFVFNGGTFTSTISIPSGRTAIQSVEVSNFSISWAASAQELSTQLVGPDGTSLSLFTQGCASYELKDIWTFSDAGTQTAPNSKFDSKCDEPGGIFKPAPLGQMLSIFATKPASGTWSLRATDNGETFTNQGSIVSWALRVVHAPPTLTASGPGTVNLGTNLALTATSNATGSVTVGGGASPSVTPMSANQATRVPFEVPAAVRNTAQKKGKATLDVSLTFLDDTSGTASATVPVTVTAKKCKKGRKLKKGKCVKRKRKK